MAALTANKTNLDHSSRGETDVFVIKNSQTMYLDGLCGLDANGVIIPWDDTAITHRFLGPLRSFERALYNGAVVTAGNTSLTPPHRGVVRIDGRKINKVDVTGVSDRTSIGEPVYCASDNVADMTLTPTDFVKPVGRLVDFISATDQSVELFTPAEYAAYGSIGHWIFTLPLATLDDGDIITAFTPGFRGRLIKMYAVTTVVASTASKASTLNLEVGTTDVTGGTLALTTSTCDVLGEVTAAAAMTAGQGFGATDTISVKAASTTTFGEGQIDLVIMYQADE